MDSQSKTGAPIVVAAARHADDPIIYFTLVDFLIQLLFFSLFLFAVFRFGGKPEDDFASLQIPKAELPFYKGMSELVTADSQRQMLDALRELKEQGLLEDFLEFANNREEPLAIIGFCANHPELCQGLSVQCEKNPSACERLSSASQAQVSTMLRAIGYAPCIAGGSPLLSIVAYGDGRLGEEGYYVVRDIYREGGSVLAAHGIKLRAGQRIDKSAARRLFEPLRRETLGCAHYIYYIPESDSELLKAILQTVFYVRTREVVDGTLRPRAILTD